MSISTTATATSPQVRTDGTKAKRTLLAISASDNVWFDGEMKYPDYTFRIEYAISITGERLPFSIGRLIKNPDL